MPVMPVGPKFCWEFAIDNVIDSTTMTKNFEVEIGLVMVHL